MTVCRILGTYVKVPDYHLTLANISSISTLRKLIFILGSHFTLTFTDPRYGSGGLTPCPAYWFLASYNDHLMRVNILLAYMRVKSYWESGSPWVGEGVIGIAWGCACAIDTCETFHMNGSLIHHTGILSLTCGMRGDHIHLRDTCGCCACFLRTTGFSEVVLLTHSSVELSGHFG